MTEFQRLLANARRNRRKMSDYDRARHSEALSKVVGGGLLFALLILYLRSCT